MAVRLLTEAGSVGGVRRARPACWTRPSRAGWQSGRLAETTGEFHRRLVELSAMATLGMIAGMLHEITVRHTAFVFKERRPVSKGDYEKVMRSYRRLMEFMRSGDGAAAEGHWRKHLDTTRNLLLKRLETRQGPRRRRLTSRRACGEIALLRRRIAICPQAVASADHSTCTGMSSDRRLARHHVGDVHIASFEFARSPRPPSGIPAAADGTVARRAG